MALLYLGHPQFLEHVLPQGHPERPARLVAIAEAMAATGIDGALTPLEPRPAQPAELARVHTERHIAFIEHLDAKGGGRIDADTAMSAGSGQAALLAAGAGLVAIEHLRAGAGDAAIAAVRPPGHHATPEQAMGFCLYNNVAVTAAALVEMGERVLIVDYDVHHGNGTQDAFYRSGDVLFVSMHQHPLYPGSGAAEDVGVGDGFGTTVNVPLPAGTTGDVYLAAWDELIAPVVDEFAPTWLLISAGFDTHRRDPIASMALTDGDFSLLTQRACEAVPHGRTVAFLEGGYDLQGLGTGFAAMVAALAEAPMYTEGPTSGSGLDWVARVADLRSRATT